MKAERGSSNKDKRAYGESLAARRRQGYRRLAEAIVFGGEVCDEASDERVMLLDLPRGMRAKQAALRR